MHTTTQTILQAQTFFAKPKAALPFNKLDYWTQEKAIHNWFAHHYQEDTDWLECELELFKQDKLSKYGIHISKFTWENDRAGISANFEAEVANIPKFIKEFRAAVKPQYRILRQSELCIYVDLDGEVGMEDEQPKFLAGLQDFFDDLRSELSHNLTNGWEYVQSEEYAEACILANGYRFNHRGEIV